MANPPKKSTSIRDLGAPAKAAAPSIQHPLAGTKMTGAEMIVQVLADEGVTTIFGYSGGAILPTYDAVFCFNEERKARGESQMPLIVPANEQGAGFMAAGYARASGRVGVAIVTSGPGATNTVTPIRDCMADSIPIVVICGQVPTGAIGTDAFQEAPVPSIMGSVAKHIFLVTDPDKLEATVRTAFEIARTGRPGPVVIDIPKDVQNWSGEFKGSGTLPMPGYRKRLETLTTDIIDGTEANHFFEMLGESQRPLIYAGGGVINGNAAAELREFAQAFDIPVVTTLMGIGAVDTTHPLSMRMLGMHGAAFANYAVDDCDFLIAVGARFDDRVAGMPAKFAPGAKYIAHFDIDRAEINKVKRVQWSHVGLLPEALRMLTAHGKRAGLQARPFQVAGVSRGVQAEIRDELRSREPADPALLRDRGDQPRHAGRGHHLHRRRASTRCGPRSISISAIRACGSPRARWARWASACPRRSVRSSPTPTSWSSTSTAMPRCA